MKRTMFVVMAAALWILAACSPVAGPPPIATDSAQAAAVGQATVAFAPGQRVGGPTTITARASGPDVRWILPGPRALDPAVFGTPAMPLGYDADVGVPLKARLTTEDGSAYTTTAGPTPFSNKAAPIAGDFVLGVVDRTLIDGPDSQDEAELTANFSGPNGKQYTVKLLKVIPKGPVHPFFGGVATNIIQHGGTGIGTRMMPQVYAYVAFWGVAELSVDGEVVASNRLVHGMITDDVRNENYELVWNDGVDHSNTQLHLILPPTEITPNGPQPSPLPTGFILPNGSEQPFLHIMFENVTME